jgi:hypothetical protein
MHSRLWLGGALLSAVSALAICLTACSGHAPPPKMVPTGPSATRVEDLSGEYCYFGFDFNVRSYGRSIHDIPFLPVGDLGSPALVSLQATNDRLVFRYAASDGSEHEYCFDFAPYKAAWHDSSLVVKHSIVPIPLPISGGFDVSGHSRESRIFKLADGRLVMTDSTRHKGYEQQGRSGNFYAETRTVAIILDLATGGCDAGVEGRPRQPWFERGADLRDPACAAQLEAQIASILVQRKQDSAAAALAASRAVDSLVTGALSSADFAVLPEPEQVFFFKVAKKSSGCVLKLYYREKRFRRGGGASYSSFASRPLPACACND